MLDRQSVCFDGFRGGRFFAKSMHRDPFAQVCVVLRSRGGRRSGGEELWLLAIRGPPDLARPLLLWRQGADFLVRDESPTGTFLTDSVLRVTACGWGSFPAGGYSFEFTGISLRRTRPGAAKRAVGSAFAPPADAFLARSPCNRAVLLSEYLAEAARGSQHCTKCAVAGINPSTTGTVLIEGRSIVDAAGGRGGIGFVPQDDIVHPELRVGCGAFQRTATSGSSRPLHPTRVLVDETIQRLGFSRTPSQRSFQLSGGQPQRVSIATELLDKPAVLFLDEPSSGLDPATEFALMKILRGLAAHDCTVIVRRMC